MGRRYRPGSLVEVTKFARLPRIGEVWAYVDPGGALVPCTVVCGRGGLARFGSRETRSGQQIPSSDCSSARSFSCTTVLGSGCHVAGTPLRRLSGSWLVFSPADWPHWLGHVRRYVKSSVWIEAVNGSNQHRMLYSWLRWDGGRTPGSKETPTHVRPTEI